jgi:peroxiredoxin
VNVAALKAKDRCNRLHFGQYHLGRDAWGKEHARQVTMLGDGSAEFTQAIGLDLDRTEAGMGIRSQRYSMVVENGVVTALNVEPSGQYGVSSAEAMLQKL